MISVITVAELIIYQLNYLQKALSWLKKLLCKQQNKFVFSLICQHVLLNLPSSYFCNSVSWHDLHYLSHPLVAINHKISQLATNWFASHMLPQPNEQVMSSSEALRTTFHPYTITSRSQPFQIKAVSQQAQKLLTRNTQKEMDMPRISTNKITSEMQCTHTYF